jgi:hypothetical protein
MLEVHELVAIVAPATRRPLEEVLSLDSAGLLEALIAAHAGGANADADEEVEMLLVGGTGGGGAGGGGARGGGARGGGGARSRAAASTDAANSGLECHWRHLKKRLRRELGGRRSRRRGWRHAQAVVAKCLVPVR